MDCVIFGFRTDSLRILLIERDLGTTTGNRRQDFKLPGDFISPREDLDLAAYRTLEELTGLRDIYLKPFAVFGKPTRISSPEDKQWLFETTGHPVDRVITSAYLALINISEDRKPPALHPNAHWVRLDELPFLAFDHRDILEEGLRHLQQELRNEPIGIELLPEKFTLRQLQNVYEAILGRTLDNRNFRKKTLRASYLVQLDEKQSGVAHKPAHFYRFDRMQYEQSKNKSFGFQF
ncbi:MAG: NUDIX domain-containing protein [Bacteroidales bacterium]